MYGTQRLDQGSPRRLRKGPLPVPRWQPRRFRYFADDEKSFLASIGLRPINLYDYAEDFVSAAEPDWETFLLIAAARRDYFLFEQKARKSGGDHRRSAAADVGHPRWNCLVAPDHSKGARISPGSPLSRHHVLLRRRSSVPKGKWPAPGGLPPGRLGRKTDDQKILSFVRRSGTPNEPTS